MILVDGVVHDGPMVPFDPTDRGLTLADGLFETMPAFSGRVWRLADHLDRLEAGLATLGFTVPRARLEADVATAAATVGPAGAVIRLTVTRGAGARGLAPPAAPTPTVIVTAAPFNPALVGEPTTLATVAIRRNETSPASRVKTLAYLDAVLALSAAQSLGARDALLLNGAGRVACTSVANLFRVVGDRLETPPVADGVLPGIARARVMALAASLGLDARERSLGPADLINGAALFLTNSVRLLQPVTALDGRPLPASDHVATLLGALRRDVDADCGPAA